MAGYYANLAPDKVRLPSTGVLVAPAELEDWLVDVNWTGGGMAGGGLPALAHLCGVGRAGRGSDAGPAGGSQEGGRVKVQNALGAPLSPGCVWLGKKYYALPELADGAEALATAASRDAPSSWRARAAVREHALGVALRSQGGHDWQFTLPLTEGAFVAKLGGAGFAPLATLKVELHEGLHFVRGQVDRHERPARPSR